LISKDIPSSLNGKRSTDNERVVFGVEQSTPSGIRKSYISESTALNFADNLSLRLKPLSYIFIWYICYI